MGLIRHSRHITKGPRWKALRLQALRRDGWQCVQCGARGRLEIDHVRPVRTHPALAWDLGNLQCLCPSHHTRKTNFEITGREPDPERSKWRKLLRQTQ